MVIDYIIGLMTSDGYTSKYVSKQGVISYRYSIELSDKQILEDISNLLNTKLFYRKRIIKNKEREFYRVQIPPNYLFDYIYCLNKDRSGIYNYYKNCNDKYDFIRGLFDGDGSVSYKTNSNTLLRVGFSINSRCSDIKLVIDDFIKTNNLCGSTYLDKRGSGSYYISINSQENVYKFYNYIYQNNPELYLKRKYNKFTEQNNI